MRICLETQVLLQEDEESMEWAGFDRMESSRRAYEQYVENGHAFFLNL
jgi:hypothetical protein